MPLAMEMSGAVAHARARIKPWRIDLFEPSQIAALGTLPWKRNSHPPEKVELLLDHAIGAVAVAAGDDIFKNFIGHVFNVVGKIRGGDGRGVARLLRLAPRKSFITGAVHRE